MFNMEEFRLILQRNHLYLLENLDVDGGILDWLYQEGVLSADQLETLYAQETRKSKIRRLILQYLGQPKRGLDPYLHFLEALKCNGQKYIADELEKKNCPAKDETESQAEIDQDGLETTQPNDVVGFVHQIQEKRRSRNGNYYLSFHLQKGPQEFVRCLSFSPDLHHDILQHLQENRQTVSIAKFKYLSPLDGYNEAPTMMITAHSYIYPTVSKGDAGFEYREMVTVYTPLGEISKLNHGQFINVRVRVISQGNRTNKVVEKEWNEDDSSMEFQEKIVRDENGNDALLAVWGEFVDKITPEKGLIEIKDVSVKEFQNNKHLSTNINSTVKSIGV